MIKLRALLTISGTLFVLVACTSPIIAPTVWQKRGADAATTNRDRSECYLQAELNARGADPTSRFEACMQARGYSKGPQWDR